MIPPNRIEQLNNFTDDLQRDTALSNLRALQALQQGIPSLMMGMEPMQTPILNMNEGGLVSLPVVHKLFGGGFNPFRPIQRVARGIGKGISNIGKSVGKGLSGIFKGLTGGGNFGDTLKTMALMAAFSMMGAPGGMNPHIWRMLYGGFTPALARGKLDFDPMSAAMTVGGGYLGDKFMGPGAAPKSMGDIGNMQAGVNTGTMNASQMLTGGIDPSNAVNLASTATPPTTVNPAQLFGNPNAVPNGSGNSNPLAGMSGYILSR